MKAIYTLLMIIILSACAVNKPSKSIHPYHGDAIGCGNLIVYKLTEDNTGFLSIAFSANEVKWEDRQVYAISKADIVEVKISKYDAPVHQTLCNDLMVDKQKLLAEEYATEGILEVLVAESEQEKSGKKEGYKVTLILKNVIFQNQVIDYLRLEDVYVGWLPG